jgi:hypothetical protein
MAGDTGRIWEAGGRQIRLAKSGRTLVPAALHPNVLAVSQPVPEFFRATGNANRTPMKARPSRLELPTIPKRKSAKAAAMRKRNPKAVSKKVKTRAERAMNQKAAPPFFRLGEPIQDFPK